MKYAQFFSSPTHEAIGSDGVFLMDGRFALRRQHALAREAARKRGYAAYQLRAGERFTASKAVSPIVEIEE